MLKQCRQKIINNLWQSYRTQSQQISILDKALLKKRIFDLPLDHFAVIDLPGRSTGIYHMKEVFSALGFVERGKDYLADKQNDFLWMAEHDAFYLAPHEVLPQVVIADFRLDEMPQSIQKIITHYSDQATPSPVFNIKKLVEHINLGDRTAAEVLKSICNRYFSGRDWELPTVNDYQTVKEFNELLAWVLVFGRKPNHFTYSIHLCKQFSDLHSFSKFIQEETSLPLNVEGGIIKGGPQHGIAQGSTQGSPLQITLADGTVEIASDFVEFVWRYPHRQKPVSNWDDYFTGFVANFADRVIESLYDQK